MTARSTRIFTQVIVKLCGSVDKKNLLCNYCKMDTSKMEADGGRRGVLARHLASIFARWQDASRWTEIKNELAKECVLGHSKWYQEAKEFESNPRKHINRLPQLQGTPPLYYGSFKIFSLLTNGPISVSCQYCIQVRIHCSSSHSSYKSIKQMGGGACLI